MSIATGMSSLDYKLGLRMLRKYPGLTLAGGFALAIAIGIGAGWYDLSGKLLAPTIPLPEGDRLVLIETQNTLTNAPEARVTRDFLDWRRELGTIEELGAYRTSNRNLMVGNSAPEPIQMAELTAAAFGAARVPPVLGRALAESDEKPGAPSVVVLGYDVWRRSFGGRQDVIGSTVKLGNTPASVIGVMPKDFRYPINHEAWTPLSFRTSYAALEGGPISVIGRLAPGVLREQANAELQVFGQRMAASLPATHEHLRPAVRQLGAAPDGLDILQLAQRNLPALLVLMIACMSVGTLVYARTATREGEIAIRSAVGASRARIIAQLFVEALLLAMIAAAVGLVAADRAITWVAGNFNRSSGGTPFWFTPGLKLSTILYGSGLALVSAAMLSILPALKVTRARLQTCLANRAAGGAMLRFGRVWTGAMIVQVALTAMGLPVVLETASEAMRNLRIRSAFPSREYVAARIDVEQRSGDEAAPAIEARREQTLTEFQRRIAQEPGVVTVTFADRAPGSVSRARAGEVRSSTGTGPAFRNRFWTSTVDTGFFDGFDRPILAGRAFHGGDRAPRARTVIVNEAFARALSQHWGGGSPIGARLQYSPSSAGPNASTAEPWFEIVGIVRDFGLDPDDSGNERPFVFHAASAGAVAPLVISVRVRGDAAALAARLPFLAAHVDGRLLVEDGQPLDAWVRERDTGLIAAAAAQAAITVVILFLSALSIFSLVSVSVSRRTREIGLRTALGANPRQVLARILSRAMALMGSGIAAGGALLLLLVAKGGPAEDVALYAGYFGLTSAIMIAACVLACIAPARRALRINPADALREA